MDYDLAVIGGGAAGLTAAGIAANAGVKTLLVEAHRLGGDCTWDGCIPSKTLLHAARVAHTVREAGRFGIGAEAPRVDFPAVMGHVRAVRADVYRDADAPELFEAFGVTVVHGRARFVNPHALEIRADGEAPRRVTARRFVICAGGRPRVPPLPGLDGVPYHTNRTLFELEAQPRRLAILGAGPVGIEMAQAFARLGTEVTVVGRAPEILSRDEPVLAAMLRQRLHAEGVRFVLGATVARVAQAGDAVEVHLQGGALRAADALLVATGREPAIEGLGLDAAGVACTRAGITVDDGGRTSQRHVWAAGDCTGEFALTHMSEHTAKVAVTNAVLRVPMRIDRAHVPWVTFTDPELGRVGASEAELRAAGTRHEVYRFPYARLDRAVTEGATTGEVRVLATAWTGRILGASVLGERAGELVSLYAVAMKNGVGLKALADTLHPYPTYALGARRAADQWYARKQYPAAVKALQRVFGYRGRVPPPPDPERIV